MAAGYVEEFGEELESLWQATKSATSAVGAFIKEAYGAEPYSEWVQKNPQAALAEGGQPREWRDPKAPGFQASLMQQKAYPEITEASFVSPSQAVRDLALLVARRASSEGGNVADALWKGLRLTKGPHGEPVEYFSDRGARAFLDRLSGVPRPLREVVEHDEAFGRVGELRKTRIAFGEKNAYSPSKDLITLVERDLALMEKSLWHEWEHAIARKTGLPVGTSPELQEQGVLELAAQEGKTLSPLEHRMRSEMAYWNHPGEQLARMNASMTTSSDELVELMRPVFRFPKGK